MLIAALIPTIYFPAMLLLSVSVFPVIILLIYALSCFFVLIWGCTQVIWVLTCKKYVRILIFLAWLILYPALCVSCYFFMPLCYIWIFLHPH